MTLEEYIKIKHSLDITGTIRNLLKNDDVVYEDKIYTDQLVYAKMFYADKNLTKENLLLILAIKHQFGGNVSVTIYFRTDIYDTILNIVDPELKKDIEENDQAYDNYLLNTEVNETVIKMFEKKNEIHSRLEIIYGYVGEALESLLRTRVGNIFKITDNLDEINKFFTFKTYTSSYIVYDIDEEIINQFTEHFKFIKQRIKQIIQTKIRRKQKFIRSVMTVCNSPPKFSVLY